MDIMHLVNKQVGWRFSLVETCWPQST